MTTGTSYDPIPGRAFPARSSRQSEASLIFETDLVSLVEASGDVIAACLAELEAANFPVSDETLRLARKLGLIAC